MPVNLVKTPVEMPMTVQQDKFCHEVLLSISATQAGRNAGYLGSGVRTQVSRLMKMPKIIKRIAELKKARSEYTGIEAARVLEELARIGFGSIKDLMHADGTMKNPKEWTEKEAAMVQSYEVTKVDRKTGDAIAWKVRLWDKNTALDKIGRHLNLFIPDIAAVSFAISFDDDDASVL